MLKSLNAAARFRRLGFAFWANFGDRPGRRFFYEVFKKMRITEAHRKIARDIVGNWAHAVDAHAPAFDWEKLIDEIADALAKAQSAGRLGLDAETLADRHAD